MALLSSVDASTFAELSKRLHQKLKHQHALTLPLNQFRELMIQSVGHRSLHDARMAWAKSTAQPPASLSMNGPQSSTPPAAQPPTTGAGLTKPSEDRKDIQSSAQVRPEQGNLLFWEEIGLPEPGTRDNPLPQAPTPDSWREARSVAPLLPAHGGPSKLEMSRGLPPVNPKAPKHR